MGKLVGSMLVINKESNMRKLILILVGLYILSGCATHAQKEINRINEQFAIADKAAVACLKSVVNSPVNQRLEKLFIIDTDDPGRIAKLTINRYVTKQEAEDLIEFSTLRRPCAKTIIDGFSKAHQDYGLVWAVIFADADADIIKLFNKKLTIGDANQRTIDRVNRLKQDISDVGKHITANMEYSHNQQIAQRQRAAEAMQRWGNNQALINSINSLHH